MNTCIICKYEIDLMSFMGDRMSFHICRDCDTCVHARCLKKAGSTLFSSLKEFQDEHIIQVHSAIDII